MTIDYQLAQFIISIFDAAVLLAVLVIVVRVLTVEKAQQTDLISLCHKQVGQPTGAAVWTSYEPAPVEHPGPAPEPVVSGKAGHEGVFALSLPVTGNAKEDLEKIMAEVTKHYYS